MTRDPYEILGVARDATLREASAAYKRLVELFHPDRLQGLREDVQAEGAQRLRDATEAMRYLRSHLRRPLVAPGHEHAHDEPQRRAKTATVPVRSTGDSGAMAPSDAATTEEARLYDVELYSVDAPDFHVRWGGRHAAATLAALRHGHRIDGGPIKQVEWGTYEALLDGGATRRLLESVLPADDEWREQPAVLVKVATDIGQRLPARQDDSGKPIVPLCAVLEMLDEQIWYRVLADVY
ncbi:MAG: J domain-containing protein [Acidimicrobiales bacterium]